MKPTVYVLLLRGINVGGNQIIRMADLKEVLSRTGLMEDVETYIQSGNILFTTTQSDRKLLADGIAQSLKENFGFTNKAGKSKLGNLSIAIPILKNNEFDLQTQEEIANNYQKIEDIKQMLLTEFEKIENIKIEL
jgi:uncharacterized protein (DUF1697 family)